MKNNQTVGKMKDQINAIEISGLFLFHPEGASTLHIPETQKVSFAFLQRYGGGASILPWFYILHQKSVIDKKHLSTRLIECSPLDMVKRP